jgi:hypothetical protein
MISKKLLIIPIVTALFSAMALAKGNVNKFRTSRLNATEFPNIHLAPNRETSNLKPFDESQQTTHDIKSAKRAHRLRE